METAVSLFVLIVLVLVPLLPALLAGAARKAQARAERELAQRRAAPRPSPPPSRPLSHEHRSLEEIHERPISLEMLPARPSLEEVRSLVPVTLEAMPELSGPPAPLDASVDASAQALRRRAPRALLERPLDVRRAVILAAVLGEPRGTEPWRD